VVLRVSEIDRGLLVEAVRLLERAARGESIRDEAERFTAGLEIRLTDETDASGRKVARVYLRRPSR
jgi:hypothetical protein